MKLLLVLILGISVLNAVNPIFISQARYNYQVLCIPPVNYSVMHNCQIQSYDQYKFLCTSSIENKILITDCYGSVITTEPIDDLTLIFYRIGSILPIFGMLCIAAIIISCISSLR